MLFPTFTFAVFFAIVLPTGWYLHRRPVAWKLFMLGASYVFYGWWDWRFLGLIIASSIVNQGLALAVYRSPTDAGRKFALWTAVAFNLAMLGYFKYAKWFITSLEESFGLDLGGTTWNIVLPVGISFFTFQALSYVIDIYRGNIEPARQLEFAVYLAFFPQLVAGPIVRATEFLPQLRSRLDPRSVDLSRAAFLIGAGLFKKVVISSYLAEALVDDVFAFPDRFSSLEVLLGVYGYAIQIYADFSGYTDIAIGTAMLMGFRFPDNFDRPYSAISIQDFWRRWHMTLSRWLRDYLYISMGGNRGGRNKRDRNLFLTMLLGGLWHGAAWNFVFWGAYQGAGLGVERRWDEYRRSRAQVGAHEHTPALRDNPWFARFVTFHFVCLGWIFFRAPDMGAAFDVIARLFTGWGAESTAITWVLVLTIAASLAAQFVPRVGTANLQADVSRLPAWAIGAAFGVWLLVIDQLGPEGVAPFIYFQF